MTRGAYEMIGFAGIEEELDRLRKRVAMYEDLLVCPTRAPHEGKWFVSAVGYNLPKFKQLNVLFETKDEALQAIRTHIERVSHGNV
jgi:hypothetical protein